MIASMPGSQVASLEGDERYFTRSPVYIPAVKPATPKKSQDDQPGDISDYPMSRETYRLLRQVRFSGPVITIFYELNKTLDQKLFRCKVWEEISVCELISPPVLFVTQTVKVLRNPEIIHNYLILANYPRI